MLLLKFKFKFLSRNSNTNFVNKPPMSSILSKIMKLSIKMRIWSRKRDVVLFWGYLYPFCSTFFTFFTLFSIFIYFGSDKNTSALVACCLVVSIFTFCWSWCQWQFITLVRFAEKKYKDWLNIVTRLVTSVRVKSDVFQKNPKGAKRKYIGKTLQC